MTKRKNCGTKVDDVILLRFGQEMLVFYIICTIQLCFSTRQRTRVLPKKLFDRILGVPYFSCYISNTVHNDVRGNCDSRG